VEVRPTVRFLKLIKKGHRIKMELELICSNCGYFFPASMKNPTKYGICLYDNNSCKELIEEKKFLGETEACKHFEALEEFEIDDNSRLGRELRHRKNTVDQIEKIDWKTIPIDRHVAQLNNPDKDKQLKALSTLASLAILGNKKAFDPLIEYFKKLPPPNTLDEVHFKLEVFRYVKYTKNELVIIPYLINELYHIQSNNTTRQWISKILQYLEFCPINMIRDPLEKLLKERRFSHKLKAKIKNTIIACEEKHF